MRAYSIHLLCCCCFLVWQCLNTVHAENLPEDQHAMVAMRMIGHRVLLAAGDSSSRILPVEKEGNQFRLRFSAPFSFEPGQLVSLVDSMARVANLAEGYIVEVQQCDSGKVVYSYEMGFQKQNDIVPCNGRWQPKDCYTILLTLLPPSSVSPGDISTLQSASPQMPAWALPLVIAGVLLSLGLLVVYRWQNSRMENLPGNHVMSIGDFHFDAHSMQLSLGNQKAELTGKEAELLMLLYRHANNTVERNTILQEVWGDDGDYIGRTLDVFVSKLRKKLEADESLKIVNIRGVGYKLVIGA